MSVSRLQALLASHILQEQCGLGSNKYVTVHVTCKRITGNLLKPSQITLDHVLCLAPQYQSTLCVCR
jgi:hypothetical protein